MLDKEGGEDGMLWDSKGRLGNSQVEEKEHTCGKLIPARPPRNSRTWGILANRVEWILSILIRLR